MSPTIEDLRSLLDGPAPAVLTTYRRDGSAATSPVWVSWNEAEGVLEAVIAEGDVKLSHLRRDRRCAIVVFEAAPPFRGLEVRGEPELRPGDVGAVRASIAGRYLGPIDGPRFAERRASTAGVLLRLPTDGARVWDLSAILPP